MLRTTFVLGYAIFSKKITIVARSSSLLWRESYISSSSI